MLLLLCGCGKLAVKGRDEMVKTIGERIRELRNERGLTQKELGERAGIAEPTIRRYELGKLNPKFETVQKIASGLNVPASCVYGLDAEKDPQKQKDIEEMLFSSVMPSGDVDIKKFTDALVNAKAKEYVEQYSDLIWFESMTDTLYEAYLKSWSDEKIFDVLGRSFRELNRVGKIEALKRVDELTKIPHYQRPTEPAQDVPSAPDDKEPDKK